MGLCGQITAGKLYQTSYIGILHNGLNHTAGRGHIGDAVNQQHLTQCLMPFKGIQRNALIHHNIAVRNFILFQAECFQLFTGIDIGLVSDGLNDTGNGAGTHTDKIFSAFC